LLACEPFEAEAKKLRVTCDQLTRENVTIQNELIRLHAQQANELSRLNEDHIQAQAAMTEQLSLRAELVRLTAEAKAAQEKLQQEVLGKEDQVQKLQGQYDAAVTDLRKAHAQHDERLRGTESEKSHLQGNTNPIFFQLIHPHPRVVFLSVEVANKSHHFASVRVFVISEVAIVSL
jgi:hypothetical protein